MDKIKIGLPRGIFYYYYGDLLKTFFNYLEIELIVSPPSNKQIYEAGSSIANDEMCSASKLYLGHVNYLVDKVSYIIIPRLDNYGLDNQTCTNFLSLYDITNNLFVLKILNFNIDYLKGENEYKGIMKIGRELNIPLKDIKNAYIKTKKYLKKLEKERINNNYHALLSKKIKILLIGHPYVIYDNLLGKNITYFLEKSNVEIIYSDKFNKVLVNEQATLLSKTSYFKHSKEVIGSIKLVEQYIDGIVFISSFPCGIDSIANEIVFRKIDIPHLNIIIDDVNTTSGIETRLESFIDILERKKQCRK